MGAQCTAANVFYFYKERERIGKKRIEKNETNRQTNNKQEEKEEDRLVPFRTMVASTTEAKTT